jgi:hypothetical protein
MRVLRTTLSLTLLAIQIATAYGQDVKITAAGKSAKESKRTAHRMRIPVDRLTNLREALQTATDLARRLNPVPAQQMNHLGQLWVQLNRPQAASAIQSLMNTVRTAAGNAGSLNEYQLECMSFQGLLQTLSQLDPDLATEQAREWPRAPDGLGEEADKLLTRQVEQYRRQNAQQMIYQDPQKAAKLYSELEPSSSTDYSLRAQLALQLARAGQKDQAYKIVDGVIADYSRRKTSQSAFQDFTGFLSQITQLDSARFMTGLNLISDPSSRPAGTDSGTRNVSVGDQSIPISNSDYTLLQFLRSGFANRPALLFKTLESLPDLKSRLDAVGGVDSFLSPDAVRGGGVSFSYSSSGGGIGVGYGGGIGGGYGRGVNGTDTVGALISELKGKAATTPSSVRQKLSEKFKEPDDIDPLLSLAQRASYEDPDLAELALEVARPLVFRVQPLEKRAMLLQSLVRAYRNCDGEVDRSLLQEGFILADQLRQSQEQQATAPARINTAGDLLQQAMIAESAVDDFASAMSFLRAMPDSEAKLASCFRIVEALRQ